MNGTEPIHADTPPEGGQGLIVLVPVFDDWEAVSLMLAALDRELSAAGLAADIMLVDDGSITPVPADCGSRGFRAIRHVEALVLRRNLGHQRAIAVGLAFIEANRPCRVVVIMDGDGEDRPEDVPRLVNACDTTRGQKIIFAERMRRSESASFRVLYHLYRILHYSLTGISVRVGNFSAIPWAILQRLVAVSELWSHYAAAVHKARLPMGCVPTTRGQRLQGRSRMNLVALVAHGLTAMAVFGDRIGVRLLIAVGGLIVLTLASMTVVVGVRLFSSLAIPGWATYVTGLLLVLLVQMLGVALAFVFVILGSRDAASVLPSRDHGHFVSRVQQVL